MVANGQPMDPGRCGIQQLCVGLRQLHKLIHAVVAVGRDGETQRVGREPVHAVGRIHVVAHILPWVGRALSGLAAERCGEPNRPGEVVTRRYAPVFRPVRGPACSGRETARLSDAAVTWRTSPWSGSPTGPAPSTVLAPRSRWRDPLLACWFSRDLVYAGRRLGRGTAGVVGPPGDLLRPSSWSTAWSSSWAGPSHTGTSDHGCDGRPPRGHRGGAGGVDGAVGCCRSAGAVRRGRCARDPRSSDGRGVSGSCGVRHAPQRSAARHAGDKDPPARVR